MNNTVDALVWVVLIVRVGILVAIVWYGVSEFKRWKRKQKKRHIETSDQD